MKVAIIGGGPAGLYAACAIKQARIESDITLFEAQGESLHANGLGYTLQHLGINLLAKIDANFQQHLFTKTPPHHINEALYKTNNDARRLPFSPGISVTRPALLHYLREQMLQVGTQIENRHIDQQDLKIMDNHYDLVIGADGVNSAVRQRYSNKLGANTRPLGLHYSWFINETEQVRTEACFYAFKAPEGVVMLTSYPLTKNRQVVIIEMSEACLSKGNFRGKTPEQAAPYLNQVLSQNGDIMDLQAAGLPWYRFYTNTINSLHFGKFALVGDAAMAFHYSAGQGVTNAFTMAFTLATCLQRNPKLKDALQHYTRASKLALHKAEHLMFRRAHWLENIDTHFAQNADEDLIDLFLGKRPSRPQQHIAGHTGFNSLGLSPHSS